MSVFVAEGKKKSKTTLLSDIMTCASCLADSSLHTDPPWAVSTYTAWACGEKQLGLRQVKAGGAFQVHQNMPPAHPSMTMCQHCCIISHYSQVMGLVHEKEAEWSCNSFLKPDHQIKSIAKCYKECNFLSTIGTKWNCSLTAQPDWSEHNTMVPVWGRNICLSNGLIMPQKVHTFKYVNHIW